MGAIENEFVRYIPTFIVAIQADGKTLMMNDRMLRSLGYTEDEVEGTDYLKTFIPQGDQEIVAKNLEMLAESEHPAVSESHVLAKNGQELLVEWHGRAVFKGDDLAYFLAAGIDSTMLKRANVAQIEYSDLLEKTVQDRTAELTKATEHLQREIEERKLVEEGLRKNEESIRQLIERAPIAMAISSGLDIQLINKKATELFGYTMEDLLNVDHWWSRAYPNIPGHDPEKIKAEWAVMIKQAIEKGTETEPIERWVTCKDGSTRYVKINAIPIGTKVLVTFFDLTERKQAEERERKETNETLKESEEMFKILFQNVTDPILIHDLEGRILDLNPAACKKFGCSRKDMPEKLEIVKETSYNSQIINEKAKLKWNGVTSVELIGRLIDYKGTKVVISTARDFTSSKNKDETLKLPRSTSSALFRAFVDAMLSRSINRDQLVKTINDMIHSGEIIPLGRRIVSSKEVAPTSDNVGTTPKQSSDLEIDDEISLTKQEFFTAIRRVGKIIRRSDPSVPIEESIADLIANSGFSKYEFILIPGTSYAIKEERPNIIMELFSELIHCGLDGLCISRYPPEGLQESYNIPLERTIWLTQRKNEAKYNFMDPTNFTRLSNMISKFLDMAEDPVVLIEGLSYLISQNSYEAVLRFIQSLRDEVVMKRALLLIAIDPLSFNMVELHRLDSELQPLDIGQKAI